MCECVSPRLLYAYTHHSDCPRYEAQTPSLSKFEADIARYGEVSNNVQKEDTLVRNFI